MKNGKIAQCPVAIRDELNRRLLDGQRGVEILKWVNAQPAVTQLMQERFGGKAINSPNLTEWRKGGYEEWRKERNRQEGMRAMAEGAATPGANGGKLLDGCMAELVRKVYPLVEKLQEGAPVEEIERITGIVTQLRNSELAARKVEQKDRALEIAQQHMAFRKQVFKAKEGSVKAETGNEEGDRGLTGRAERMPAHLYWKFWKYRAECHAKLAAEAWKGGTPCTERITEDAVVTTIRHTAEGATVVGQTKDGQPVEVTAEVREYWEGRVGRSLAGGPSPVISNQLSVGSGGQLAPNIEHPTSNTEHSKEEAAGMTGGGQTVSSNQLSGSGGRSAVSDQQSAASQTEQTTAGPAVPPYPQATEGEGQTMTQSGAETVGPPSFAKASEDESEPGQLDSGEGCFLVTGGDAAMTVEKSAAQLRYEQELEERDRRVKIKEELFRKECAERDPFKEFRRGYVPPPPSLGTGRLWGV